MDFSINSLCILFKEGPQQLALPFNDGVKRFSFRSSKRRPERSAGRVEWPRSVTVPAIQHGKGSPQSNGTWHARQTECRFLQSTLQSKHSITWTLTIHITDRDWQVSSTTISYPGSLGFRSWTYGQVIALCGLPQSLVTKSEMPFQIKPDRSLLYLSQVIYH
jgi:hypothetical protein